MTTVIRRFEPTTSRFVPIARTIRDFLTLDSSFLDPERVGESAAEVLNGEDVYVSLKTYQHAVWDVYSQGRDQSLLAKGAYAAFSRELAYQFWVITKQFGINVEFTDEDPTIIDPKTGKISYKLFFEDYERTGVLRIYRSEDGFHPLLDIDHIEHNGRKENMNTIFRAVHDFLGHLAMGNPFTWKGETLAYYSHAATFSETARAALFCEAVGQQAGYAVTGDYVPQRCVYFGPAWHRPPVD